MRRLFILLGVFALLGSAWGVKATREQLALAEKENDALSQIELIRRILEVEPSDAALREKLIRLWMQVGDYNMAEASITAFPGAPEALRAEVAAAVLFYRDSDAAGAIRHLTEYRSKDPANEAILQQLTRYLQSAQDDAALIALLDSVTGIDGRADLLLARAQAKRRLANLGGALADFSSAARLDSQQTETARVEFERLEAGLPLLVKTDARLASEPTDFTALALRARLLSDFGVHRDVVGPEIQAVADMAPNSAAARLLRARWEGSYERALARENIDLNVPDPAPKEFQQLLDLDRAVINQPGDANALSARAVALQDLAGQSRLALEDADAALEIDPSQLSALAVRIRALAALGNVPAAAATLRKLQNRNPPKATVDRALFDVATAEFRMGRLQSALDYADAGVALSISPEWFRFQATVLTRLGRQAEADAALAQSKKLNKK